MDYSKWLFIDHEDLIDIPQKYTLDDWRREFQNCMIKGSRQKLKGNWEDVEYVSSLYTPISRTILDRCPKLKCVMMRAHGFHGVDLSECQRRRINVVSVGVYNKECAQYLINYGQVSGPPYLFYGYGRIAKLAESVLIPDHLPTYVVNSKTSRDEILEMASKCRTVLASVPIQPPNRPIVFGSSFFRACNGVSFVSICHKELIDNVALHEALESGRVLNAVVDYLGESDKHLIENHKNVTWTKATSWAIGFDMHRYVNDVKKVVDEISAGLPYSREVIRY